MTRRGPSGGKDPFKFHTGDDIWQFGMLVIIQMQWVKSFKTGRYDNGTHVERSLSCHVIEVDGIGGTNLFAGAAFALFEKDTPIRIDGIFEGYRLGIGDIYGLALDDPFVEFIGCFGRTFLSAGAAGNAFVHVHVAGELVYGNRKVTFSTFNGG